MLGTVLEYLTSGYIGSVEQVIRNPKRRPLVKKKNHVEGGRADVDRNREEPDGTVEVVV